MSTINYYMYLCYCIYHAMASLLIRCNYIDNNYYVIVYTFHFAYVTLKWLFTHMIIAFIV